MKNANPVSLRSGAWWLWLLTVWLVGCGGQPVPPEQVKPAAHYFPISVGGREVNLQLAITDQEMEQGLMYRTNLRGNQGMLFLYREPRQVSFWMRNTPTPLDIGYFTGDGVLREVYPLYPFDERSVPSKRDDIQYALEVPQGWFEATGVKPGAKLDLAAVATAVRERGFRPRDYRGLR